MNILYVAPDVPVPHTGTFIGGSTHTLKIAEDLEKKGNTIYIVSRRITGQKKYERFGKNIFVYRVYRGILFPAHDAVSKKTYENNRNSMFPGLFKVLKTIYFLGIYRLVLMIIVSKIILKKNIDIILERNSSKGIGVFTGLLLGVPAITEVIDPDYSNISLQFSRKIFAYTYKIFNEKFPVGKVELISAGVDTDKFKPNIEGNRVRKRYGMEDKNVAIYVGEMSAWHGAEDLAAVADMLDENSRILIVGKNVEMLKGKSEKLIFTGFVNHEMVPEYIAAADVAIAPYNPKGFKDMERYGFYFSPIKIFEYMACGKPIVATDIDIVRDIIREHRCGMLAEPGNIEELSNSVRYLFENKEEAMEMGKRGREAVIEHYTWKRVAEQIYEGMCRIVNSCN